MLVGKIYKSSTSTKWLVECAIIGVFTQGRTRAEAEEMLVDAVQEVVNRPGVAVSLARLDGDAVLIDANQPGALAAYVLKYQREVHGLSLADVAKRLGASSRNAYASYEQGRTEPTLSKYRELLKAVAPEAALTVGEREPRAKARRRPQPRKRRAA